jgi:hypothetical protein
MILNLITTTCMYVDSATIMLQPNENLRASHQLTHDQCRCITQQQLVTKILYEKVKHVQRNHWEAGLAYLTHHSIPQAELRSTLITQINFRLEADVLQTFHDVIESCVEASKPPTRNQAADSDPTAIWMLVMLFERLVMAPNHDREKSIDQVIHERMRMFRSGQIEQVVQDSKKVQSKSPREQANHPPDSSKAAQIAMDNNNFSTASAHLTTNLPVALINDSNIQICRDLHPPSLAIPEPHDKPRSTRLSKKNKKKLMVTPNQIMILLTQLRRAKATGNDLDSLDIFVKMATTHARSRKKNSTMFVKPDTLASFFSQIIQGDLPPRIAKIFRTTYLVALRKCEVDPTRLRPLNIPSALRRISAKVILHLYRTRFAKHLLPFNYVFGVNGGIDFIISTVRLGVEKYITKRQNDGLLPTRVLLSIDIKNMFNSVSRQKLRHIVGEDFPDLLPFVDMLYANKDQSMVKLEDGSWETIDVEEGFAQGCPLSPVFAGIVLNHILRKLDRLMMQRAEDRHRQCLQQGLSSDDNQGGIPIVMGYMDDINAIVHAKDAAFFMYHFKCLGLPLGAIPNQEKNRVMTSTNGQKLTDLLRESNDPHLQSTGEGLLQMIQEILPKMEHHRKSLTASEC